MPAQPKVISPIDRPDDVTAIQAAQTRGDDDAPRQVEVRVQPPAGHDTPLIHDRTYFVAGHEARIEFADTASVPQTPSMPAE